MRVGDHQKASLVEQLCLTPSIKWIDGHDAIANDAIAKKFVELDTFGIDYSR